MDADRRIGVAVGERRRHLGVHGAGQRVLLVRTVHPDHLHGAAPLDDDVVGQCMVFLVQLSGDQRGAGLDEALAAADDDFLERGGLAEQIVAIEAAKRDPLAAPASASAALAR